MDTSALHLRDFTKAILKIRIMYHIADRPTSMTRGYLTEQMRVYVHERLIL